MKSILVFSILCLVGQKVNAWGGLFNRFSPEMLANMGYGGHGGGGGLMRNDGDENALEEPLGEGGDDDPCYMKACSANEYCCPNQICVDVDGIHGTCLYFFGRRVGELCRRDNDCESGLVCAEAQAGVSTRVCRPPLRQDKQYSEPCNMSSECDISRGLCCQLQRRHRQAPRRVCSYFKDPLVCVGPVAADQVKNTIEHTAGEKRLTSLGSFKRPMH
ncbi:ITG-like peptide isoform X1 [Diabrotica virgifera virgifera]|uniref:ITG-like peptide isoform X1 n=1 Tax=Diabrotica virgifera virgifera TaxID=50390 RepID=A0A6P7GAF0_DIAVI|nr:ITG-like peptide isoform X1 [Diabrotica virgifera virgifera]